MSQPILELANVESSYGPVQAHPEVVKAYLGG